MDAFNARDLSMFAWGMAKLGLMPPAAFLEVYVQRIEFMAGEFPPQEVANTVWALACFNVRPSSVLLVQLFDATDQRLSTFKASELSQLLWALADRRCYFFHRERAGVADTVNRDDKGPGGDIFERLE